MKRFWLENTNDDSATLDPNTGRTYERTYHEMDLEPSEDIFNKLKVTTITTGANMETGLNFDFIMNYIPGS
jgi:hypothetical protein